MMRNKKRKRKSEKKIRQQKQEKRVQRGRTWIKVFRTKTKRRQESSTAVEFIGVLRHMQQYFSHICDGTDVVHTFGRASNANVPVYFIDRESAQFRFILNYLRNGCQVDIDTLPKYHRYLHEILTEARFYCCRGLEREIFYKLSTICCAWDSILVHLALEFS